MTRVKLKMKKIKLNIKLMMLLLISSFLWGCSNGTGGGGGNPTEGTGVVNLTSSKLGSSGDFIDINGDGMDDLVAGAPDANASPRKGAIVAYYRTSSGFASSPSWFVMGESEGDNFGQSIARVGDVDGDGKIDFAVGAPNAEGGAPLSGAVYVYKGGGIPTLLAKLDGNNALDKFGSSIAGGDVNGDGKGDIIVSAPYTFTETGFQSGAVYIHFGGSAISTTPDITIKGDKVNANIGSRIAAGDINGDGLADIFISAGSTVYIYYGRNDIAAYLASSQAPDVVIRSDSGGKGGSGFGTAMAYLGDINGDGFGDIAIGNPKRSEPSIYDNKGSVYIFKGADNLPSEIWESDTTYRLAKIIGSSPADRVGSSIIVTGDVDGGGTPDILVGAVWATGGASGKTLVTGKVYLFYGEHLLEDPAMVHDPSHAAQTYTTDAGSGGYGALLAVSSDGMFFTGEPFYSNHNGKCNIVDIKNGGSMGGDSENSGDGGDSDGHDHVH